MFDWKAILPGLLITIIISLFCQLIFTLIASFIGGTHDTSFIATHKQQLWLFFGFLTLAISMFIGGFTTALFSHGSGLVNAITVGAVAGLLSILVSLTNSSPTLMSLVVLAVGMGFAAWGSRTCDAWAAAQGAAE